MAGKGHNGFAGHRLRELFEQVERLNEEIDALNSAKSEVYQTAKAEGFDVKIMRIVVSRRQMDRAEVVERDELIELYEEALKGAGTKSATRARARDEAED